MIGTRKIEWMMAFLVLICIFWPSSEQIGLAQASPPICPPAMSQTTCDAEILALELSGALLPPLSLYQNLYQDLNTIRDFHGAMNDVSHSPRWAPGQLVVGFTDEAWAELQAGEYDGFDNLASEFGDAALELIAQSFVIMQFNERYNPEYLAPLYGAAEGVTYAQPNWLTNSSSQIQVSAPDYTFVLGWGDCLAGCIFQHFWHFRVEEGDVILVQEYGHPLPSSHQVFLPLLQR